jgi:hypothetical protein
MRAKPCAAVREPIAINWTERDGTGPAAIAACLGLAAMAEPGHHADLFE